MRTDVFNRSRATNGLQTASAMTGQRNPSALWRLTKDVVSHYRLSLIIVIACIIVASMTTIVSTLFTRTLIDDYIIPLTQAAVPDYSPLARALLKLGGVLLIGVCCSYTYNRLMIRVSQGTMLRLRQSVFTRMQRLPLSYFDQRPHGDIMSVYTNDVDSLRQAIGQSLPSVLSSLITIIATLTSMLVLNIPLTLVSLLMAVVMYTVSRRIGNRSRQHFRDQQTTLGALNAYIEEMVEGQKEIKVFCHEEEAVRQFEALNEHLRSSACAANQTANIVMPINGNLGLVGYVLIGTIGAWIALHSPVALTLGTLVSFLTLNKSFTQPISHISQQLNSLLNASVGAERVYALNDEKEETDDGDVITVVDDDDRLMWQLPTGERRMVEGDVDFRHVDFGYQENRQVLYDICINTSPGQKIAFVGGTGAGKTTIINLINRFYDIWKGQLLYDGIPVNDIGKHSLRSTMSIVLQETSLFSDTVMENIRYGRLEATDEECRQAAQLVGADGFIQRLAKGYETPLTANGANLSQGERQLLAIARVAVANPLVLILDEATSSIDTHTERIVQQGMDTIMSGRTTFVIAHRLSTVHNADIIIVLDHGRIIEQGTHAELIERKGKYYQLYTGRQL